MQNPRWRSDCLADNPLTVLQGDIPQQRVASRSAYLACPMNLPTWITLSRLLGLPVILGALYAPGTPARWLGVAVFLLAASTDWLDGYLARRRGEVTALGKFLDPLVDKLLVLGPLAVLVELGAIPAWGLFLIVGRELAITGWRVDPQLGAQGAITGASTWGKLKTVSQIAAVALLMAPLPRAWDGIAQAAFWLAVGLTLISGGLYWIAPTWARMRSSSEKSTSAS